MKYAIVKFISTDKFFYYNYDNKLELKIDDAVLVDNGQNIEASNIIEVADNLKKLKSIKNIGSLEEGQGEILRKITPADQKKINALKKLAKEYIPECQKKITRYHLPMKLLDADLSYDGKKLTFYFSSEGRIDFRALVSDLIRTFHKTIRLQQVGSRDEARIFGGFGPCGRKICCSSFLKNLDSVTLDMAKEQDFSGGIAKISGLCGKLMCCLSYELEEYKRLKENLPAVGKMIKTDDGQGKVISHSVIKQSVRVRLKDDKITEVKI